jgi:hypothetical protein
MVLVTKRTTQHPQGSQKVPLGDGGGPTTTMLIEGQEFEDSGPTTYGGPNHPEAGLLRQ